MTAAACKLEAAWRVACRIRDGIKARVRKEEPADPHFLVKLFTASGGKVDHKDGAWRARFGSFRATCTSSDQGAVANWVAQVERKWVRHVDVQVLGGGEP